MSMDYSLFPTGLFRASKWRNISNDSTALYMRLWCLAAECDSLGALVEDGNPIDRDGLAYLLRHSGSMDEFNSWLQPLIDSGLITQQGNVLIMAEFGRANPKTQAQRREEWKNQKRGKASKSTEPPPPDIPMDSGEIPQGIQEESDHVLNSSNVNINESNSVGVLNDSESADSVKESAKPKRVDEFFDRLVDITCSDPKLNGANIGKTKAQLLRAGATLEQLDHFKAYWYAADWRGKQGQPPKLQQVVAEWGPAKKWIPGASQQRSHQRSHRASVQPEQQSRIGKGMNF